MPAITNTHSTSSITHPMKTYLTHNSHKKLSLGRGLGNPLQPVNLIVQSDCHRRQTSPYGKTLSDEDSSFFGFEPPTASCQVQSAASNPNGPDESSPWHYSDIQLISPPNSAVFSPKPWPEFEYVTGRPPSILTDMDPINARTQYGQVTPTDDEHSDTFTRPDPQLQQKGAAAGGNKRRKRTSALVESPSTPVAKRSRREVHHVDNPDAPQADPNNQEGIRRSKFLERNRVAASKCRQKKKQWIENLEAKARSLQAQYNHLNAAVDSLKEELLYLKVEVVRHKDCEGSEIQKLIKDEGDAFGEAMDRLEQAEREKQTRSPDSSSPPSDNGMERVPPAKDAGSTKHSDQPSSPAAPLDELKLADALLQHGFFQDTSDLMVSGLVSPRPISIFT